MLKEQNKMRIFREGTGGARQQNRRERWQARNNSGDNSLGAKWFRHRHCSKWFCHLFLSLACYPFRHRVQVEALRPCNHPFLIMKLPRAYLQQQS